eukprot:jgi/Mesvir1/12960/Mv05972-RA.1
MLNGTGKRRSLSLFYLALLFSAGILLQILGCAFYGNWWPMLSAMMYVMVPIPCLFFGGGASDDYTSMSASFGGGGDSDDDGWLAGAKFMTGFSGVGSIAIPTILRHAGIIAFGAYVMQLASAAVLGITILLYRRFSRLDMDW